MNLHDWINDGFADIAKKLPGLVKQGAASFSCGHAAGYKSALLDLDNVLDDLGSYYYCIHCRSTSPVSMKCGCCGLDK